MSYFCSSCLITRTFLNSGRMHLKVGSFSTVSSLPSYCTRVSVTEFRNRGLGNYARLSTVDKSRFLKTSNVVGGRYGFCTKATKPEEENEDKEFEKMLKRVSDLEQDLSEEEQQVLKELEEEERLIREERGVEKEENDYFIWEGSFEKDSDLKGGDNDDTGRLKRSVSEGHVRFENKQRVIQDVIDQVWNPLPELEEEETDPEPQFYPRGKTGVFDLGELVDLLREEHACEVVAITLPKELDYADYMVIATVNNDKHLLALAQFVRKRYKMKLLRPSDVLPHLERKANHKGWIALDLGNIILQLFIQQIRDYYDLETLWTVGCHYDDLYNAPDAEIVELLKSIK